MAATDCRCVLTAKDNGRSRSNRACRDSLPRPPDQTRSGSSPRRTQGHRRQDSATRRRCRPPLKARVRRASTDDKGPERRNRRGEARLGPGRGRRSAAGGPPHRSQPRRSHPDLSGRRRQRAVRLRTRHRPRPSRVIPASELGPRTHNCAPRAALPETETQAVLPQTRPIRPSTRSADRRKPNHVQRDPPTRKP